MTKYNNAYKFGLRITAQYNMKKYLDILDLFVI